MKILYLTIKKKYFDMIPDPKDEEYREYKNYWIKRLMSRHFDYDAIRFANGGHHGPKIPFKLIESRGLCIGQGNPDFGAPKGKDVFILKLGKIIEKGNLKPAG